VLIGFARVVIGVAIAVGVVASAASCADGPDQPLLNIGMLAPPKPSGEVCAFTADLKGPFLSVGTLDLAFTRQYNAILLLGNTLIPPRSASRDPVEPEFNVEGAIVQVTDADGNLLDDYTVLGVGFLQDASGGQPGIGTFETTLVSQAAADKLGTFSGTKRLTSFVKVFGHSSGGTFAESGEVPFAIDACVGCLVVFPPDADDPASATQPNCDLSSSSDAITPPCILGQDQPIDCRLCASTNAPFPPSNANVCEP